MFLILSGVQGSGKGTQGKILEEKFGFRIFETGGKLREITKQDSELGRKVKSIIDAGNLVTLDVIEEIILDFILSLKPGENVIFDGIPRNKEQKELMDKLLEKYDFKVLSLELPKEKVEERLLGRRTCEKCKKVFPASYKDEKCDVCDGNLFKRDDDTDEDAIKKRIDIFFSETAPLIAEYKAEGKVIEIDADRNIEDVTNEILTKLNLQKC